ncbi:MAG: NAD(P)H-dependent oxidoreductase subunit E [Halanaerobiales bacterium]|nr:NAD(P)H-dependent oxidoreductase subunit E [Halanaerobiales bacterium]
MSKVKVEICIGTPCYLMGARELIDEMQRMKKEYEDKIELKSLHCIEERCEMAPIVKVNGEIYEEVTYDKLQKLVKEKLARL